MDERNMDCEGFTPAHLSTPSNDEEAKVITGKETA
jgi:hypothetical protein